MAAVCDVCAKGPGFGKSVSHSHRRTNRRWNPNIQSVRTEVAPGNTRKVNVCTSCLKAELFLSCLLLCLCRGPSCDDPDT